MSFDAWIRRQLAGGIVGGLLSPTPPAPDSNRGTGMMAGVSGFDPSDPGAYGNRTAGDNDLRGYGGSPRLPDSDFNYGALSSLGSQLMAMGAPSAPSGRPSWQPQASPIHRPDQGAAQAAQMLLNTFKFGHDPEEVALTQEMMRRKLPFQGLLGYWP